MISLLELEKYYLLISFTCFVNFIKGFLYSSFSVAYNLQTIFCRLFGLNNIYTKKNINRILLLLFMHCVRTSFRFFYIILNPLFWIFHNLFQEELAFLYL